MESIALMIYVIVAMLTLLAGIILTVFGATDENKKMTIFGIIALCIGILLLAFSFIGTSEPYCEFDSTTLLYALTNGSGVSGTFILGSGSVNDTQYYLGYTNTGDKSYKQVKFDASKSTLILDDNEIPRAERYKIGELKTSILPFVDPYIEKINYEYKIYIPTDGLSNTYSIN